MATIPLPPDFKDFLRLLSSNKVEFLLVGGYAVGYYGYVRATADLDIWVASTQMNAQRLVIAIQAFGFKPPELDEKLFLEPNKIIRMGIPPVRIELLTTVSGVAFDECWQDRKVVEWDDLPVPIISLHHLKANKKASGRIKDLVDLDHLP